MRNTGVNPETNLHTKLIAFINLTNIHLNHFPKHEKYGLCTQIRTCIYDLYNLVTECNKRYHKKTTLTTLDIRYVDDFVLVGLDKSEANCLKVKIEKFLKDNLELELSKFRIAKIKQGCNFVGFRTWQSMKFIRKHTLHNFSKAVKKGKQDSIISILGHAKHSSSHKYLISKLGA